MRSWEVSSSSYSFSSIVVRPPLSRRLRSAKPPERGESSPGRLGDSPQGEHRDGLGRK
jgi:hypothetical protein